MDKLQEFIERNRVGLSDVEPPYGHADRFKAKLMAQPTKTKINPWLVASAAAIAGLILTASFSLLLGLTGFSPLLQNDFLTISLSPELVQISESYQYQVNQKQHIINRMLADDSSPLKVEIQSTIDELNKGQQGMLEELTNSPKPDRARFVISRYYQTKLAVLEGIISNLDEAKLDNESL
ncbi:MAG: hypothetical protein PHD06_03655 [Bacteroidales bacterium]|jgi:hypothetical protein|nr:hypothetical protein [Bacteroidales bacterium]MDD4384256.1 hypothetical protein [Bacteroidales bacterium]MDY0197414.1 hypothetical protein [Tenuifilaceae bacterium]